MNANRLLGEGESFYHVISRTTNREFYFKSAKDKEVCKKIMRNLEKFLSCRVITYCLMSNHFHILLEVPDRETLEPLTEERLLELLPLLYDDTYVLTVQQMFERARALKDKQSRDAEIARILNKYEKRRASLSAFVGEFKQRVSKYINKEHDRRGTLWESRFTSVLVEGNEGTVLTMAAYIDLNPVRAGMVKRPEDYRWCGLGGLSS